MLFAVLNMVFVSTVPAFAAAKSDKIDTRKIERCVSDVERKAKKLGNKLPSILTEAAVRMCWVSEDRKTALGVLDSLSLDAIKRSLEQVDRLQIQQGFDGRARTQEPGLLGLDGARELLSDILFREAVFLWSLAKAKGGPEIPLENTGVRSGTSTSANGMELTYTINDGTGGQGSFADQYVKVHIQALEGNPDTALGVKLRMFNALKAIALKPQSQRTKLEQRYLTAFDGYLREQYVRMIDAAVAKKEEYEREQREKPGTAMEGVFNIGSAPPDYTEYMGAAITAGASAAALGAVIGTAATASSTIASTSSAVLAAAAAQANAAMATLAASGASSAMASATAAEISAATSAALASAGSTSAVVTGIIVAPVLVVVGAVVAAVLGTKVVIQQANADKVMKQLLAWKKSGRISVTTLLGTREGNMQFEHFFTKSTASSSPSIAGYVNPADGCKACFYSDAGFKGDMVCTNKGISNLTAAPSNGKTIKMNKKISSVALDQSNCPNSYAVLYTGTKYKGDRKYLRSSIGDLSAFNLGKKKDWNDAAMAVAFIDDDAPKCEVCVFTKANYQGAKYCMTTGGLNKLSTVGMRDKITSVQMNTKDCPSAGAWLYRKNNYVRKANGSGVTEVTSSVADLGKGVRNTASSLYFAADGKNPYEVPASGGCRVCMYDRADHKGEYMCVNDNIPDMGRYRIAGEFYDFNNKASSVQVIRDACQKNDAMELEIYTKPNFNGKVIRIFGQDMMNLKGPANNVASSAKLHHYDTTKSCRLCMYEDANYQGQKVCVTKDSPTVPSGFNNKISSIRLEKGGCSDGGAVIFGTKNYGGKTQEITRSYRDLKALKRGSQNWNDALSSVRFAPNYTQLKAQVMENVQQAMAPTQPKPVDPATLCQICLYKDKNYNGEKQCITGKAGSFSATLNNSVSSVKVERGACPKGGAIVYKNKNYGGKSAFILNSIPDLQSVPGSDMNWNNAMSSLKFSANQRDSMVQGFKRVMPTASEAQIKAKIIQIYGK
ncbi:peptidase inhibitor family I36 protein [Magnetospira thiophila]